MLINKFQLITLYNNFCVFLVSKINFSNISHEYINTQYVHILSFFKVIKMKIKMKVLLILNVFMNY